MDIFVKKNTIGDGYKEIHAEICGEKYKILLNDEYLPSIFIETLVTDGKNIDFCINSIIITNFNGELKLNLLIPIYSQFTLISNKPFTLKYKYKVLNDIAIKRFYDMTFDQSFSCCTSKKIWHMNLAYMNACCHPIYLINEDIEEFLTIFRKDSQKIWNMLNL